ncbi:MAG: urea ABC transporter permease subunit UrtB, partial [Pseudomonadota bacterium]
MIWITRLFLLCVLVLPFRAEAQDMDAPIQQLLQTHGEIIAKSSRRTIGPAIDALASSGMAEAQVVLQRWQDKEMWYDKDTRAFVFAEEIEDRQLRLLDVADGTEFGTAEKKAYKQLKPNSGIRGMIAAALVQFQLSDADPNVRTTALDAIERDAEASHLTALRAAIDDEPNIQIRARKARLERLLTIRFDEDDATRIAAIEGFAGDLGVDVRAALNPLVATRIDYADAAPEGATIITPGSDALSTAAAYDLMVSAGDAPARTDASTIRQTLIDNIDGTTVAGIQIATLNTDTARLDAYATLARDGAADPLVTDATISTALAAVTFFEVYVGAPPNVAAAAANALSDIEAAVALNQTADLALDALSLASIYFLAAIG